MNAAIAGAVAAAECITALSAASSRRLPALTTAAPSKDPKKTSSPSADAGPLSTPTLFSLLDVDPHSALQLVLPLL
jgi:hypothetical protein